MNAQATDEYVERLLQRLDGVNFRLEHGMYRDDDEKEFLIGQRELYEKVMRTI